MNRIHLELKLLPVKNKGLGRRRALQLAPSSFVAPAAFCSELVSHIFPAHLQGSWMRPWFCGLMTLIHHLLKALVQHQNAWDSRRITAIASKLLEDVQDERSCAWLLAASTHESVGELIGAPCCSIGMSMEDYNLHGSRISSYVLSVQAPRIAFATHNRSCRLSESRQFRHSFLNDITHHVNSQNSISGVAF